MHGALSIVALAHVAHLFVHDLLLLRDALTPGRGRTLAWPLNTDAPSLPLQIPAGWEARAATRIQVFANNLEGGWTGQ